MIFFLIWLLGVISAYWITCRFVILDSSDRYKWDNSDRKFCLLLSCVFSWILFAISLLMYLFKFLVNYMSTSTSNKYNINKILNFFVECLKKIEPKNNEK